MSRSHLERDTTSGEPFVPAKEALIEHLTRLRDVLPYEAAQLVLYDRVRDEHLEVVRVDYSEQSGHALAIDFPIEWPKKVWYAIDEKDTLPPSIGAERDVPGSFQQSSIYRDVLHPEGFRDGLTLELTHAGQYTGLANFSAEKAGTYSTELRARGSALEGILGHLLHSLAQESRSLPENARAAVVDQRGVVTEVTGKRLTPLISDPDFIAVLQPLFTASTPETSFLWDIDRRWYRVLVKRLDQHSGRPGSSATRLLVSTVSTERPYQLTRAELRTLTYMVGSASNEAIAFAMGVSERTVHTHVANVLAKMGCERRTQAVVRAVRYSLFRPEPHPVASLGSLAS
ncbi:MAG: LuxR C-terminal-related transcriptional regulator [Homoserinimonas sp.]